MDTADNYKDPDPGNEYWSIMISRSPGGVDQLKTKNKSLWQLVPATGSPRLRVTATVSVGHSHGESHIHGHAGSQFPNRSQLAKLKFTR